MVKHQFVALKLWVQVPLPTKKEQLLNRMAERFKAPVLKTEVSNLGTWVRIPFRPFKI